MSHISCIQYKTTNELRHLLDEIYTYNKNFQENNIGTEIVNIHFASIKKKCIEFDFPEGTQWLIFKGPIYEEVVAYFKPLKYNAKIYNNVSMGHYFTPRIPVGEHKDEMVERIAYALGKLELGIY